MPARIAWNDGGEATVTVLDGDKVTLRSTRAWPPGSRPEGRLDPDARRFWMKVHGSHREDDGAFRVQGRLLDATRELRQALAAALVASG